MHGLNLQRRALLSLPLSTFAHAAEAGLNARRRYRLFPALRARGGDGGSAGRIWFVWIFWRLVGTLGVLMNDACLAGRRWRDVEAAFSGRRRTARISGHVLRWKGKDGSGRDGTVSVARRLDGPRVRRGPHPPGGGVTPLGSDPGRWGDGRGASAVGAPGEYVSHRDPHSLGDGRSGHQSRTCRRARTGGGE